MAFNMIVTFEGFKNEAEAIAVLKQRIAGLSGALHHNTFDKEDRHLYKVVTYDPGWDGGKEANIGVHVTRKSAADLAFTGGSSQTKELGLSDS